MPNSQSPITYPLFYMFSTLIAGISLLIFSTLTKSYMSYILLREMQDIPGKKIIN